MAEERCWRVPESRVAHLFVDARGRPGRCAAVLFIDGACLFTDGPPSKDIMKRFQQRADNQIMTLEILAISVGLSTFAKELAGRKVIVFSDNTGAEAHVPANVCRALTYTRFIICAGRQPQRKCLLVGSLQPDPRNLVLLSAKQDILVDRKSAERG